MSELFPKFTSFKILKLDVNNSLIKTFFIYKALYSNFAIALGIELIL